MGFIGWFFRIGLWLIICPPNPDPGFHSPGPLMILPTMLTITVSVTRNVTVKAGGFSHEMIDVLKMRSWEKAHSVIPT